MQAEYFDAERPAVELEQFFQSLGRMNRLFCFGLPFQRLVPRLLGDSNCVALSILDLGAGDGSLGKGLTEWAGRRGWTWRVTNLDVSLGAIELNGHGWNVVGSAMKLPFRSGSYDLVIASQMTHHLKDCEVQQLFLEAWRVARQAIVLCDLHRNAILYFLLWLILVLQDHSESFRGDALLSVKKSWRTAELRALVLSSGITNAQVRRYYGARIIVQGRKAH
jgi:ubiquinone/menaquinone biosynthesis C-methylase UbiE